VSGGRFRPTGPSSPGIAGVLSISRARAAEPNLEPASEEEQDVRERRQVA